MNPGSVRQIGPYPVARFIAEGGISWVFEVTDPDRFDAPLALKMLKPSMSEEIFRRFKEEAGILAGLDHPNLITIRTFGFDDVSGCHYYTMALVTGGHLGDHGAVPLEEAAEVFLEVLGGLAKLHERNVIHRDIKPSNILTREDGRPMLADLGLARGADVAEGDTWSANTGPGSLSAGMAIGTPAYMSPEQGTGRLGGIGKATDVFSFGLTMYSTLTGHSIYDKTWRSGPMSGTEILTLLSVRALTRTNLQFSFDSEFAIPASVQDVIRTTCAINPADRYPDAPAMLRALRKALADSDAFVAERASLLERLRAPDRVERTLSLDRISRARTGYDKVTQPTQGHPGLRVDENVQFTAYRPARVPAERWVELLAFAYLAERRTFLNGVDRNPRLFFLCSKDLGQRDWGPALGRDMKHEAEVWDAGFSPQWPARSHASQDGVASLRDVAPAPRTVEVPTAIAEPQQRLASLRDRAPELSPFGPES